METSGLTSLSCTDRRHELLQVFRSGSTGRAAFVCPLCSRRFLWPCPREPAELGFGGGSAGARSASRSGLRISAKETGEATKRDERDFPKTRGGKKSSLTSYESLMRSVMLVCLAGGASGSPLLGSGAAGGEGETQDDSSLPIWSRKLQEAKKSYPHLTFEQNDFLLTAASLTWSGSGAPGRHRRWCTAAPCWPPAPPGPAGRWP